MIKKWERTEKPCVNSWYPCNDGSGDYYKIVRDYFDQDRNMVLYKIVSYDYGDCIYSGSTLADIREIMRACTDHSV